MNKQQKAAQRQPYPPYRASTTQRSAKPEAQQQAEVRFNEIDPLSVVEHATVREFMRRIPHRWNLNDMCRFGDQCKRSAEALQIAFVTTTDPALGMVRMYPVPMMRGIYEVLANQFGWAKIVDAEIPGLPTAGVPASAASTIRSHEIIERHLRALLEVVEDEGVSNCIVGVLNYVEEDLARLKAEKPQG